MIQNGTSYAPVTTYIVALTALEVAQITRGLCGDDAGDTQGLFEQFDDLRKRYNIPELAVIDRCCDDDDCEDCI